MAHFRIRSLDLLRSIAVLWVVATHTASFPDGSLANKIASWGALGVDLFFVLSGYLIASQWFKELSEGQASFRNFFIKRTFRIWPNYFFLLALFLLFPALQGGDLSHLWRYFLFVQNFYPAAGYATTWSLCIEEHFYLVFPFLAYYCWRSKRVHPAALVGLLLVLSIFTRFYFWWKVRPDMLWLQSKELSEQAYYNYFYRPSITRLDGLLFGVSIAAIERFRPEIWRRMQAVGSWWMVASGLVFLATVAIGSNALARFLPAAFLFPGAPAGRGLMPSTFSIFGFDLAFACLLLAALCERSILYRLRVPFVGTIATLSFAVYLIHPNVIHLLTDFFEHWGISQKGILPTAAHFAGSFAAGWVIYRLVERPFMRVRSRFLVKPKAAAEVERRVAELSTALESGV